MSFKHLLMGGVTAFFVAGCGGDEANDNSGADTENVRSVTRESALTPVDPDAPHKDVKRSQSTQKRPTVATKSQPTIWDKALSFDDENLIRLFLVSDESYLNDEIVLRYEICRADRREFVVMSENEFAFEDFLSSEKPKVINSLRAFQNTHEADGLYTFQGSLEARLGDYNFDTSTFAFTPLNFDMIEEFNNERDVYCDSRLRPAVERPASWPEEFKLTFSNAAQINGLKMDKDKAKELIAGMSFAGHNIDRNVIFDFVFTVNPKTTELTENRSGKPDFELEGKITRAFVHQKYVPADEYTTDENGIKYRGGISGRGPDGVSVSFGDASTVIPDKRQIIAEFPESYFAD